VTTFPVALVRAVPLSQIRDLADNHRGTVEWSGEIELGRTAAR
jgi:hypothetical protein